MFDLGWIEIFFLLVLALVVIGPKDLPKFARMAGQVLTRARRMYREMAGNLTRLEREIDIASRPEGSRPAYVDLLPEHLRKALDEPHAHDHFTHNSDLRPLPTVETAPAAVENPPSPEGSTAEPAPR